MNAPLRSGRAALLGLLALCQAAGCGAGAGAVTGTVTYKGQVVASGTVLVVGSNSLPYHGIIGADGAYTVPRVPTGLAKIAVFSPDPSASQRFRPVPGAVRPRPEQQIEPAQPRSDPAKWFPLPEKYEEFSTSGLTLMVTPGVNQRDIDLD